jgi:hypothetical protein
MSESKGYRSFEEWNAAADRAAEHAATLIDPREIVMRGREGKSLEQWRELIALRLTGDDPVSTAVDPERPQWWAECKRLLEAQAPWRPEDHDDEPRVDGKSGLDLFREQS